MSTEKLRSQIDQNLSTLVEKYSAELIELDPQLIQVAEALKDFLAAVKIFG